MTQAASSPIAVVGGDANQRQSIARALSDKDLPAPQFAETAAELSGGMRDEGPSVVLCFEAVPDGVQCSHVPSWIVLTADATAGATRGAFERGAADCVSLSDPVHVALVVARELRRNDALKQEMRKARSISGRSVAMYQQRALQMETIRQQNEDLDRLAKELGRAKRLEEDRAREIEASARLKSEFLANFSHEIRTPLNGILGYCDLLAREEGSRLTPHGRRDLNVIKTNAKTLLALINDILDLSKIESGNVDVVIEEVDVVDLLGECSATVREYLKGKSVELVTQVAPDANVVFTDGLKLRQVILNLLSNAAKFTETGEIVVTVGREGDAAVITIEDTGTGMPSDQLPFIFEKFRQVDSSTTRKVGGTGLGLAIVRELTRVLGGTVEVWSELGRGSRFSLHFPSFFTASANVTRKAAPAAPHPHAGEVRFAQAGLVLVVDDDPAMRQLLRDEFRNEGFEVALATDGLEAIRLLGDRRPTAVVLDLHLPRLDGWTVLSRIKSDPELSSLPVVLISVEDARARGFALGASEFLIKPFEPDRLVAVVNQLASPAIGEVLVVDDDAGTRELVSRNLRRSGFSTAEARNGQEALLRLRTTKPSLLILDLVMPGLDGFEVLRTLRAERLTLPVIVLTGKTLTADEQTTLLEGMVKILHKDGDAIQKVIEEAKRFVVQRHKADADRLPRVLYVEDSAQNRDLVRRYLRGVFDLVEAEDGEQGLERVAQQRPSLILMDLSLPRLDGFEATRRLKADAKFAAIPVLALTAHAGKEDEQRARAAGCIEYLTKPIGRDELLAAIQRHIGAPS
jgi:CheY-like chemotaxis protein/signal transduction histidine kinase